jgi:hypothetical protein
MASLESTPPAAVDRYAGSSRWILVGALAIALGVLLSHFALQAQSAVVLIRYPYGLDYGEGIVWQQMRNIMSGQGYTPLGVYPAIVYHYPPVFHLIVGSTSRLLGTDELETGRWISWISTLGCAALIGLIAVMVGQQRKNHLVAIITALFAALIFMSTEQVRDWAPLMRVDMPAYFLSLTGLVLAMRAVDRPRLIFAAALFFTLSIYTKQVSMAAPVAAFLGLLAVKPRSAGALAAVTTILGGIALLFLTWLTDGGFLRHIILYNVNRLKPEMIAALLYPVRVHLVYVVLACAGVVMLVRRVRLSWPDRANNAAWTASAIMVLAYFGLKTLLLAMIMKSGANLNYVIEWLCAVSILAGLAIMPAVELAVAQLRNHDIRSTTSVLFPATILLTVAAQAQNLPRRPATTADSRAAAAGAERVVALIKGTTKPVISDDMSLLIRAGRPVAWEPAIAAELGASGRYDQAAFVQMILQKRFALFITEGGRGGIMYDQRYNPPVADAIATAYPKISFVNGYTVHSPG